ncbi:MAG: carbohydrate kinase [Candidatus Eiseniibacteriota bacterium]|nr:MAG: carbohydrate kinase [Candidatus Eisenbacteria bacterium]
MRVVVPDRGRLKSLVRGFSAKKVLVVGDLMLDEYVYGNTERVSREAPVLILAFNGSMVMPGGAANACANITSLGATAIPVGLVGEDEAGGRLLGLMRERGVGTDSVISSSEYESIQKTRILAGGFHCAKQQVIRIDRGKGAAVSRKDEARLTESALSMVPSVDAVLFSDYDYGVVSGRLRTRVTELARVKKKVVCADSRFKLARFRGATVATPNEAEAGPSAGIEIRDSATLVAAGTRLMERLALQSLVVTQGSSGMTVFQREKVPVHIPIFGSDEIADVTGAGDTVAATVTLSLSAGASIVEASCLATYAASVVVMKRGTAVTSAEELQGAISRGKLGPLSLLK